MFVYFCCTCFWLFESLFVVGFVSGALGLEPTSPDDFFFNQTWVLGGAFIFFLKKKTFFLGESQSTEDRFGKKSEEILMYMDHFQKLDVLGFRSQQNSTQKKYSILQYTYYCPSKSARKE